MRANNINFQVNAKDDTAEILLYDVIGADFFGGITAKQFADELNAIGKVKSIDVRINSPGGDVFDGFTMFSLLKNHSATVNVFVDGLAASIASVIAMAGDTVEISQNGMMMIHNPWTIAMGEAKEFRKKADLLDKIRDSILDTYASRTKQGRDELVAMMDAETWFTSGEAVEKGFADVAGQEAAVAACLKPELFRFKNMPKSLTEPQPTEPKISRLEELEQTIQTYKTKWRSEDAA